jgi:hypothetical protein
MVAAAGCEKVESKFDGELLPLRFLDEIESTMCRAHDENRADLDPCPTHSSASALHSVALTFPSERDRDSWPGSRRSIRQSSRAIPNVEF